MITINSITIKQPSSLAESDIQIQTDNESIDGSLQRNRLGQKKSVSMSWQYLTPAEFQTLVGYFSSGNEVIYNNTESNRSGGSYGFTGLPNYKEGEYLRGGSKLVTLDVTIREV